MLKSIFLVSGSVITTKEPFEDSVAVKSYMMRLEVLNMRFPRETPICVCHISRH